MLVYICCAGGATSSLFCKKIGDASKVPTTVEDIFTVLKNYDEYDNKYEIILAYGPAEFLKERCIREYNLGEKFQVYGLLRKNVLCCRQFKNICKV